MTQRLIKADIAVIGAGSGGLVVAAVAAPLGLKVVLFEKHEMGGDCLNTGCVPSKALIAAGKAAQAQRTSQRFGVANVAPTIDWNHVRGHVEGVIKTIEPHDSQERFEGLGVTVIREHARFVDRSTVASESVRVQARRIVIATGSVARVPPIPGLKDTPFLTNETIFKLDVLPEHLIIMGAGPIGMELGQAFRRLGARVTVLEAGRALGRSDPEAAKIALDAIRAEGVEILEGAKATAVAKTATGVAVTVEGEGGGRVIEGSHLLVAVGRAPTVSGLELEKGGVAYSEKGIETRPNLRSVSNSRVWAVGDAAGLDLFTHAASWHASVFIRNALFRAPAKAKVAHMPAVTYCEPEVAQIGLTEADARQQLGDGVRVARWAFEGNDRAIAEGASEGFAKIVTDAKGVILGASIVGDGAGDLLQLVGLCMANGLKIRALTNIIAPYPTRGEIVKRAAGQWFLGALYAPRTKILVRALSSLP